MIRDFRSRRILVVEDEYFIANDLFNALAEHGATVIGPVANVHAALQALAARPVAAAIVDLDLSGMIDFTVADELSRRRVPFLFITSHDPAMIPDRFAAIVRMGKPYRMDDLLGALLRIAA